MTRPHALLVLLTALMFSPVFASPSITYPAGKGPGAGRHLVFLTGDEEYRGEEGLPMLAKLLSQRHGFRCTVLFPLDPDGTINPDNKPMTILQVRMSPAEKATLVELADMYGVTISAFLRLTIAYVMREKPTPARPRRATMRNSTV